MSAIARNSTTFKKAVFFSFVAHLALFLLGVISPQLPKSSRKGMIHYVSLVSFPGGGSGSGSGGGGSAAGKEGAEKTPQPASAKRETLKDLTTPQKLEQEAPSSLRHPVEKPEKETRPQPEKKAVIEKAARTDMTSPSAAESAETGSGPGTGQGGSGVRVGGGGTGGGGGGGFGSAFSSQIGLSGFPYTFYLQIIINKVSSNWFTSLVDPGIRGNFQATVYFKILRNGQITDVKIEETSGIKSLDLSALRAIQSSAPFPPLPRDYEHEYLGIFLIFEHSR